MTKPLTLQSRAALARLASVGTKPAGNHFDVRPPSLSSYDQLVPLSRRAAVLVLLFKEARTGDLRVVVTMRGAGMRAYASQAALPGGHADTLDETPFVTARREAFEEIGLPLPPSHSQDEQTSSSPSQRLRALPNPFTITHLCELPTCLAKTALSVTPCIAFLGTHEDVSSFMQQDNHTTATSSSQEAPDTKAGAKAAVTAIAGIETLLTPQLDATEVAAVFSAPLLGFLRQSYRSSPSHNDSSSSSSSLPQQTQKPRYTATPFKWHTIRKIMHTFYISTADQRVHLSPSSTSPLQSLDPPSHYRIHGLTAQILIDTARLAYDVAPDFPHLESFGDEALIERLLDDGRGKYAHERERGEEFTDKDGEMVHDWLAAVDRGQAEDSTNSTKRSKDEKL